MNLLNLMNVKSGFIKGALLTLLAALLVAAYKALRKYTRDQAKQGGQQ